MDKQYERSSRPYPSSILGKKRKDVRGNQSEKKKGGKVKKVSIPNEANAVVRSFSCPISLSEDEKKAVVDRGRDATKRAQMVYGKIKEKRNFSLRPSLSVNPDAS